MTSTLETESTLLADCRRLLAQADRPRRRLVLAAGAVMVLVGVFLRFWAPTALWLDETISVNIARLPITQIPQALGHDGAPPLYYFMLHVWMLVFGQSDLAVRSLSGLISVATLPLFWTAGKRLGGRTTAWAAFALGVTSPFAIDYATNARMYSLMILWSLLGFIVVSRAIQEPTRRNLIPVGAVTAALLYTHYWALYLVAVTALWLLVRIVADNRGRRPISPNQPGVRQVFGAMVLGSLLFLPWAPVFVYQTLHTGTPWSGAAGPADLLNVFGDFGGSGPWGLLLSLILFALLILGVFGRPAPATLPGDRDPDAAPASRPLLLLVARPRGRTQALMGILLATLVVAVLAGAIAQAAFVARYAAVVLPLFLLVVAVGASVFADRRIVAGILVAASVAGLLTGLGQNSNQRTQASQVASVLNVQAQPGDEVVYCPDQLGPAVDRLLKVPGVSQLTFPRAIGPQRVDWVDYKTAISRTNVGSFARDMLSRLGADHTLWLVYRDGYPGLGGSCGYLRKWLDLLRPTGETVVDASSHSYYEYENLVRYPT